MDQDILAQAIHRGPAACTSQELKPQNRNLRDETWKDQLIPYRGATSARVPCGMTRLDRGLDTEAIIVNILGGLGWFIVHFHHDAPSLPTVATSAFLPHNASAAHIPQSTVLHVGCQSLTTRLSQFCQSFRMILIYLTQDGTP
ncbi:hypothetical protein DPSP01_003365 [Paraphaeosphaeria sporulosa]